MHLGHFLTGMALVAAAATAVPAQPRLIVRQPSHELEYGYGLGFWDDFTSQLNAAFGGSSNVVTSGVLAPGELAGYGALMLIVPQTHVGDPYLLGAAEGAEIMSFVQRGGRLYAFGENELFAPWNDSVAGLVGATIAGTIGGPFAASTTANFHTGVLTSVSSVSYEAAGSFAALGAGVSLFDASLAAVFGPSDNALVVLDMNVCDDDHIGQRDNRRFCANTADYLAGRIPAIGMVPEPSTWALVGVGLLTLGVVGRRHRRC